MRRILLVVALGVLGTAAAACGETPEAAQTGSTIVQGTVSSRLAVDNARAVAIGSDGRTFWAYLDGHNDFRLRLPVGRSYRIVIANQNPEGVGQRYIGHLVLPNGAGGTTRWLGANEAVVVDLGTLRPASSGGLRTACSACGDEADKDDDDKGDKANHDDDYECHDKDAPKSTDKGGSCSECEDGDGDKGGGDKGGGDKGGKGYGEDEECNVCKDGADDVELEPSKKPGKVCEDKEADKSDKKKGDYDDEKACPKKGGAGGGDKSGSGGDKSGSDKPAGGGGDKGGDGYGSGDKPAGGDKPASGDKPAGGEASSSGGKPSGSSCKVTNECSTTCACVASKCAPK